MSRSSISKPLQAALVVAQRRPWLNQGPIFAALAHPACRSDSAHAPTDIFSSPPRSNRPTFRSACPRTLHLSPARFESPRSDRKSVPSARAAVQNFSYSFFQCDARVGYSSQFFSSRSSSVRRQPTHPTLLPKKAAGLGGLLFGWPLSLFPELLEVIRRHDSG
jgi:hypothetical protein